MHVDEDTIILEKGIKSEGTQQRKGGGKVIECIPYKYSIQTSTDSTRQFLIARRFIHSMTQITLGLNRFMTIDRRMRNFIVQ